MHRILSIWVLLTLLLGVSTLAQDDGGTPIDFNGTINSIDGTNIIVTGLTVNVANIDPTIIAQLQVGMAITVSGTLENGAVTANILVLPEPTPTQAPAITPTVPPVITEAPTQEPSAPVNVPTTANYSVVFGGSTYDGTQTTFSYTVTGMGIPTALSHFDLEIPNCAPVLELIAFNPTDAVELGVDPTTGVDGIKWDLPLQESESRTYSLTFLGYVAEGTVTAAVKNGDGYFTVPVVGPSCAQAAIDIEKYVSADGGTTWADADDAPGIEVVTGGQVSYRLLVTNTGNVPVSNLTLATR